MAQPTEAAPAQLASLLLPSALLHAKSKPDPASSSLSSIDIALDGGYKYGEIISIAGASGMGKSLLAYQAQASHLLDTKKADVAFIDTTGSFTPYKLRDIIAARLRQRVRPPTSSLNGNPTLLTGPVEDAALKSANQLLSRVKVMRVFDFAGLIEAVGEINEAWELYALRNSRKNEKQRGPATRSFAERNEVADSEDELADDEAVDPSEQAPRDNDSHINDTEENVAGISMIVIDTVTNVVSSTMHKSQIQGHALLTTFMRTLRHLCAQHHICAILTNSTVGLNKSANPTYAQYPDNQISIFASTLGRPALGKTFAYLIDTSVFLSIVPKTKEDAEEAVQRSDPQKWNSVHILEVLKNRNSACCEGRWVAFEIKDDYRLSNAF